MEPVYGIGIKFTPAESRVSQMLYLYTTGYSGSKTPQAEIQVDGFPVKMPVPKYCMLCLACLLLCNLMIKVKTSVRSFPS